MIPSPKLRKLIIDNVVRCLQSSNNTPNENLWIKVAEMLKDHVSLSPLELKEIYFKEILPHLITNNYGHDEETVKKLKMLIKLYVFPNQSQQIDPIEEAMNELHNTPKEPTTDIFKDPNDPLQISTTCYPRQPLASSTLDDLHQIPIFEETEVTSETENSKSGNIHVRDEIGSSMTNAEARDLSYLDHRKWVGPLTFPMYSFETGRVEEYKPPKVQQQGSNNTPKSHKQKENVLNKQRLDFDMCDI